MKFVTIVTQNSTYKFNKYRNAMCCGNYLPIVMTKPENKLIELIQYDDHIQFRSVPTWLLNTLKYREKAIIENNIEFRIEEMYTLKNTSGGKIAITYPGFLERLVTAITANGWQYKIYDRRKCCKAGGFPAPRFNLMSGFRFSQESLLREALSQDKSGLIGAPTRYGKCLCKDTEVVMYDGSVKKVQDICPGDTLMGPDGQPRVAIGCTTGKDPTYRIKPNNNAAFYCNEDHILSILPGRSSDTSKAVNMTVKEFLKKPTEYKLQARLWYADIELPEKELSVDPWIVGLLAGNSVQMDGVINTIVRKKPIHKLLVDWCIRHSVPIRDEDATTDLVSVMLYLNEHSDVGSALYEVLRKCGQRRIIPTEYLFGSKEQRFQLLKGLCQSVACKCKSNNEYHFKSGYKHLVQAVIRLARSIGLPCKVEKLKLSKNDPPCLNKVVDVIITADLEQESVEDVLKNVQAKHRTASFTVTPVEERQYYGFELLGPDHLFMLWDHLVTHNTTLMVNTLRAYPDLPAVVTAPGVDLCQQLYDDLTGPRGIHDRPITLWGNGKRIRAHDGIIVCSVDSLHHLQTDNVKLLLADEPHALVTEERLPKINAFSSARRIGFGATLHGRFDGRDDLITGLFGPVLANRTYKEAVAEGAICPLHVIFLKIELPKRWFPTRNIAYDNLFFKNSTMARITAQICNEVIPADWQTLIFIKNEKQADLYKEAIGTESTVAMAKRMSKDERIEIANLMKKDVIKRCLCTKIYVQGVTFSDVRVLVNCEAGGNNTSAIQKPGRLAEIRPGKRCGIVVDFLFVEPEDCYLHDYENQHWPCLVRDSNNRLQAYRDMGYIIHEVETIEEMKLIFDIIS